MPYDLKNLDLDEVSLVGKAANSKKFLIFKSMQKSKGSMKMKDTKPAGAKAGAGEAQVTKADIASMISVEIQKAVRPLVETVQKQSTKMRKQELVGIAKSYLGELGNPEETATILMSLEDSDLSQEARTDVLKTLKQANAIKKEAMTMLGSTIGSSRPAPGSSTVQFEAIVQKHLNEIQKADTGNKSAKVLKAAATTRAMKENPELARAVMAEHKQAVHAAFIGGRQ